MTPCSSTSRSSTTGQGCTLRSASSARPKPKRGSKTRPRHDETGYSYCLHDRDRCTSVQGAFRARRQALTAGKDDTALIVADVEFRGLRGDLPLDTSSAVARSGANLAERRVLTPRGTGKTG